MTDRETLVISCLNKGKMKYFTVTEERDIILKKQHTFYNLKMFFLNN